MKIYNKTKLAVFILGGLLGTVLYAAVVGNRSINFNHIALEQGLSQTSVFSILQDSKGFMWFGTQDGLNKYDGYEFKVFRNDPENPHSLSNSNIFVLYEDRFGVLWVGTVTGGLNKFDREREVFIQYHNQPGDPTSLSHNIVQAIYEDHLGVLWIGTAGGGLNKFDRERETFTHYQNRSGDPGSLSNNNVRAIFADHEGVLWIGTIGGGLNRLVGQTSTFTHYRANPSDPASLNSDVINSIYEDHAGELWVGTNNGLHLFDRKTGRFTRYLSSPNNPASLSNNTIQAIYEDHSGVLWIGTLNGLNIFDRRKEQFTRFQKDGNNPGSLSANNVLSIYENRSEILWVGTNGGGINQFHRKGEKFVTYRSDPDNVNSLSSNFVFSIYEDSKGILWIGTNGGGLNRLDREKETFTHFRNDPNDPFSLSTDFVFALYEDRDGALWVGTAFGLNRLDRNTKSFKFTRYLNIPNDRTSLSHNLVRNIYQDRSGVLWIGTGGGGLNRFDPKTQSFAAYQDNPNDAFSLSSNNLRTIYEDSSGVLWIGTEGGGLNRFNSQTKQFTRYRMRTHDPISLSSDIVLCIYEDRKGRFWIGTFGGGMNRLDRVEQTFTHYREKHGLPNDVVYGILEDERGCLWLSTNNGLSKFDPRTGIFKNYNVKDGLQSNEFNANAYYKSRSNEMFFGGIDGFTAFFPGRIKDNSHIPPVIITNFLVSNQPVVVDTNSPLQKHITETKKITLSYKVNVFSFEFVALDYTIPEKNQYAYMMEGFDKDWVYTTSKKRFASYTNLDPGDYIFRVRGSNNDGIWNEKGAAIEITITPPVWKTWWFRVLFVLLAMVIIAAAYRWRLKYLARKTRLEAELRTAHDAQMSIMPQSDPQVPGFDISGVCVPAHEVGGDFFDYIWLNEDKTLFGIAIGDVSGKAMKAAITAVMSSGMLFLKADESNSIKEIMTRINRPLYFKTDKKMFTALCLASLDIHSKELTFTNAGLSHPMLKSNDTGVVTFIKGDGSKFPLGMVKDNVYLEKKIMLKTGDVLVFFTDGLTDSRNNNSKFYRVGTLKILLEKMETHVYSAAQIKERIIADVRAFTGSAPQNDDMTVVVVKVL